MSLNGIDKRLEEVIKGQIIKDKTLPLPEGLKKALELMNAKDSLNSEETMPLTKYILRMLKTHPHVKATFSKNPEWFKGTTKQQKEITV